MKAYNSDVTIEDFIAQHATPYDEAADNYFREPFAKDTKVGKNSAIYNAHSYHTKVPPEGIVPYILHYTEPGDLIFDPFRGSGMTGVAAMMCARPPAGVEIPAGAKLWARKAILNDLSPAACHIAYNYTHPVDVKALKAEFDRIMRELQLEFDWLYGTTCDRCNGPATIQYTIWSDVYKCCRCGNHMVLWDVAVDHDSGKVRDEFACPNPGCRFTGKKTKHTRVDSVPVVTNYECQGVCRPARSNHRTTEAELQLIEEINAREIPYWYPTDPFGPDREMWRGGHHDAPAEARASVVLRMLSRIATIQSRLATPCPQANDMARLIDAYIESEHVRLELLLALARKDADVIDDDARLGRLPMFFEQVHQQVIERLQSCDVLAGDLIRCDVRGYLEHPRSTVRFLKPLATRVRQGNKRLFVWLFDGMRYDTWTDVVRPILLQSFAIEEERPLFAPLPTYTQLARKALFAGGYPDTSWKGFGGRFTPDERVLAARNFGVMSDKEMEQATAFVDHADTDEGKEKLRALKVRQFNCLVFNISVDNLHAERGDLREINDKIRHKVERDVLPEMKRLVEPGDVIVIASDHGFVELDDQHGITVADQDAENAVFYRYLYDLEHPAGLVVPYNGKRGVDKTTVIIGRSWFNREKGRYTRYAHGGVSLPEMIVPGVVLHKLQAPEEIRLAITTPERLRVQEDEEMVVSVAVKNNGTSLVAMRVTIGNDGGKTAELSRGAERTFTVSLKAVLGLKFIPVVIEAKGPDGRYAVVPGGTRQIPLNVKERTDKVEFSKALDVFGDLE